MEFPSGDPGIMNSTFGLPSLFVIYSREEIA
jgi:hypothetical protein